jgi:hypothetical protein
MSKVKNEFIKLGDESQVNIMDRMAYKNLRQEKAVEIVNIFEDVLSEFDIIVCREEDKDERENTEGAAHIYGSICHEIEDRVKDSLDIYLDDLNDVRLIDGIIFED